MIIKLSISDSKLLWPDIKKCCLENKSSFIPIYDNIFGISSNIIGQLGFGESSFDNKRIIDNSSFICVYSCIKRKISKDKERKSNLSIFDFLQGKKKVLTLYSSVEFDNQYFINLVHFCFPKKYSLNTLEFVNQYETKIKIETPNEIIDYIENLSSDNNERINALRLHCDNFDIFITKNGYVQIKQFGAGKSDNLQISDDIKEILSVGFRNV